MIFWYDHFVSQVFEQFLFMHILMTLIFAFLMNKKLISPLLAKLI